MKLRLRRHETRETLKLELPDSITLHDLRQRINEPSPSSVHLSLNRKDELLAPSPDHTLRSLGVTSGDLIYYSLVPSAFAASLEEIALASSSEVKSQNEMGIGFAASDVDMNIQDPEEVSTGEASGHAPDPMDVEELDVELAAAGSKMLTEPFFLKKVLLEKSGDTSELTTVAMSVHAVMLESGFVLFNPDCSDNKFSFSKELLTVSLKYTLPELMTSDKGVESVTVRFQSLSDKVVVYGSLGGKLQRLYLDKRRFVPVIDLVMDTLKSDKDGSSSIYKEMFMFWRMVKDGLVIPLLIGLCDKSGLELPPCLMRLPTELKLKILESLPGASVAKMACVCTEIRYLATDNDLWKQKCLEEAKHLVVDGEGDSVNWKAKFAAFWRQYQRQVSSSRRTLRNFGMGRNRIPNPFPRIPDPDPFGWINGGGLPGPGPFIMHPGQPAGRLGGRRLGRSFSPRCNLGGNNYQQHGE
ncbi:F-box protein SKIP22-like isoform X1 [Brassica napus]|uniref:F-box protein SKIP22-like isoform X1 n=1 Tax=Brassica napus TaxID=3708 RepID=UPI002078F681|nr:F-box protein SKIP22-like isoform X1 [Brassica napus]